MLYETKSIPLDLKDIDTKQGVVTGYASRFHNVDSGGDRIKPDAFKRTIKNWGPQGKNRIKNLLHHDPTKLVGRPIELFEDDTGLLHVTQISQTTLGKDTLILLEDGVFTEQSIGYSVMNESSEGDVRDLLELKLFEYSYVTWGMNSETPILGVQSLGGNNADLPSVLQEQYSKVEKCLSRGDWQTEEIPSMLELTLKHWQEELESLTQPPKNERIVVKEGRTLSNATKQKLVVARDAIQSLLDLDDSKDQNKELDLVSSDTETSNPDLDATSDTPVVPLEAFSDIKSTIQSIDMELFNLELNRVVDNLKGKTWNN